MVNTLDGSTLAWKKNYYVKFNTFQYHQMTILIQHFLPIHFDSNSTDKNLTLHFSLNKLLCGGGLKMQLLAYQVLKTQVLIRGFLLYNTWTVFLGVCLLTDMCLLNMTSVFTVTPLTDTCLQIAKERGCQDWRAKKLVLLLAIFI